jgi:Helitron helicase-like domain at N-terminus
MPHELPYPKNPNNYVLLFPRGELGWHPDILQRNQEGADSNRKVTQLQYFAYRLFQRQGEATTILRSGKLFQQFIVDTWAAEEQSRLRWIKQNQSNLCADLYNQVVDAFAGLDNELDNNSIGRRFILPATFQGGTRDMMENLQNSLAISRKYGVADLFITMTANPKWPEVLDALLPGQTPSDRPDLVSRVFHQKKLHLIDIITKKGIFGATVAHVHTIEFQKRGLPHMHLLIWLERDHKIRTPADVDSMISPEFPDPVTHPRLFRLVSEMMTHGPCGVINVSRSCHTPKAIQTGQ